MIVLHIAATNITIRYSIMIFEAVIDMLINKLVKKR